MKITRPRTCNGNYTPLLPPSLPPSLLSVLWGGCVQEFTLLRQGGNNSVKINTPPPWKKEWLILQWAPSLTSDQISLFDVEPTYHITQITLCHPPNLLTLWLCDLNSIIAVKVSKHVTSTIEMALTMQHLRPDLSSCIKLRNVIPMLYHDTQG